MGNVVIFYNDLHQAVGTKKVGDSQKAKALLVNESGKGQRG